MPHVIVKMWPGTPEPRKRQLADEIAEAVMRTTGNAGPSVSVSIEEVQPGDWMERVYKPEITDKPGLLYRKPGYSSV